MASISRRQLLAFLPTALVFAAPCARAGSGPAPVAEVQQRLDHLYRSKTAFARIEMQIVKPERTRTMRMKMWSKGQSRALIVLESPQRDKGTATLKVDKNLWNYLPKISRTVRIPPSMMLGSWMGSDFSNDDLVKDASYSDDFDAAWAGESKQPDGWLLRLSAKAGKVGLWKRIDMVVTRDGKLPVVARYYDRKERLARTLHFEDVREMGGKTIPTVMRIVPTDKPGQYTLLRYLELEFNAPVPDSMFSLTRLKSAR